MNVEHEFLEEIVAADRALLAARTAAANISLGAMLQNAFFWAMLDDSDLDLRTSAVIAAEERGTVARRVYADWLEEDGREGARVDLIRLGCEYFELRMSGSGLDKMAAIVRPYNNAMKAAHGKALPRSGLRLDRGLVILVRGARKDLLGYPALAREPIQVVWRSEVGLPESYVERPIDEMAVGDWHWFKGLFPLASWVLFTPYSVGGQFRGNAVFHPFGDGRSIAALHDGLTLEMHVERRWRSPHPNGDMHGRIALNRRTTEISGILPIDLLPPPSLGFVRVAHHSTHSDNHVLLTWHDVHMGRRPTDPLDAEAPATEDGP